jgi:hypothetical protein
MDMFNSETILPMESSVAAVSLADAELDQVAGGILPILAGIACGAVVGAMALVVVVAAADYVSHETGHGCLLK